MPEETGGIRPVIVNSRGDRAGDAVREFRSQGFLETISLLGVKEVAKMVVTVGRRQVLFNGPGAHQGGLDPIVGRKRPRPEVMEVPLDASVRGPAVARRVL